MNEIDEEPPTLSQAYELSLEEKGTTIPVIRYKDVTRDCRVDIANSAEIISSAIDEFRLNLGEIEMGEDKTYLSQWHTLIGREGDPMFFETTEEVDCQETQTQSIEFQDAETDTENTEPEDKMEKLKSLKITLNPSVNISSSQEPEEKQNKKSRAIMKTCTAGSIHIDANPPTFAKSMSLTKAKSERSLSFTTKLKRTEAMKRRPIPDKIKYPQTFAQVGADFGFPTRFSFTDLIESFANFKWPSSDKGDVNAIADAKKAGDGQPLLDENNNIVGSESTEKEEEEKSSKLMDAAFYIFNLGLKYGYELIGAEAELSPKEDRFFYSGYKIRVCGKKLLLESVHLNCDFSIGSNDSWRRKNPSFVALKPTSLSRTELEQNCEGRRIRIVVRVAGALVRDANESDSLMTVEHTVCHTDGKWTFIFGDSESRSNFIEVACPTGVHPESLAYGLVNGLLLIDAP